MPTASMRLAQPSRYSGQAFGEQFRISKKKEFMFIGRLEPVGKAQRNWYLKRSDAEPSHSSDRPFSYCDAALLLLVHSSSPRLSEDVSLGADRDIGSQQGQYAAQNYICCRRVRGNVCIHAYQQRSRACALLFRHRAQ